VAIARGTRHWSLAGFRLRRSHCRAHAAPCTRPRVTIASRKESSRKESFKNMADVARISSVFVIVACASSSSSHSRTAQPSRIAGLLRKNPRASSSEPVLTLWVRSRIFDKRHRRAPVRPPLRAANIPISSQRNIAPCHRCHVIGAMSLARCHLRSHIPFEMRGLCSWLFALAPMRAISRI
jgi:hypothetical protein